MLRTKVHNIDEQEDYLNPCRFLPTSGEY